MLKQRLGKSGTIRFPKNEDEFGNVYIWDQFWAPSARTEIVVHATAQPSGNNS